MSILGGLVESGSEDFPVVQRSSAKAWLEKYSWGTFLACNLGFWLIVAVLLALA